MSVIDEIAAERRRQIEQEGWTPQHDDDEHDNSEMAKAAACYALPAESRPASSLDAAPRLWPWSPEWWKPKGRRRDLIRAAALIVAEIERIDRASADAAKG